MSYTPSSGYFRRRAEVVFPLRKCRISSLLLGLALILTDAAHGTDARGAAEKSPVGKALRQQAQTALESYAADHGWKEFDAQYEIWLPEGARRLPACSGPLQLQSTQSEKLPWGRLAYLVSCAGANPWSVRGRVEVRLTLPIWTARNDLPQQHELTAEDLIARRIDVTRLRDFAVNQEDILGRRTQRRIRAGQPLSASTLLPQLAVRKGEQVMILADKDGVVASIKGEALQDGSVGEAIRVRNLSSGVAIQAWVEGPGVVKTRF